MTGGPLLTIAQAAEASGRGREHLQELVDAGAIPFYRLGRLIRIDPADLANIDRPRPAPPPAEPPPVITPSAASRPARPRHAALDIDPDWRRRRANETRAEYRRRYQRERYHWIRSEFFKDKRCIDCGATDRLELDHRDPTRKVSHRIWSWSAERRAAEIAKCDIRCESCHKHRHQAQHGSRRRFDAGCRCTVCIEAVRELWRRKAATTRARRAAQSTAEASS